MSRPETNPEQFDREFRNHPSTEEPTPGRQLRAIFAACNDIKAEHSDRDADLVAVAKIERFAMELLDHFKL